MEADDCGFTRRAYVVPLSKYCARSRVVGVLFRRIGRVYVLVDFRVGTGGPSVTETVNIRTDVPLTLEPLTVTRYVIFLKAPVIVNVEPEIDAEFWGLLTTE